MLEGGLSMKRRFAAAQAAVALILGLSLFSAVPVLAAVGNDTVAGATTIHVGDTINEDTSTADATNAAETALNGSCGAPTVGHGVWFTITVATDTFVKFDTSASDYSAGIMLFAGAPSSGTFVWCGPQQIASGLLGGQVYNVLAFGDGLSEATGGNLVLAVTVGIPAPTINVTIARSAKVDRTGLVHLTGTVTCVSQDGSGTVFEVFGDVTQRVGRLLIRGFFDNFELAITCSGIAQPWDAYVLGDNGIFAGGKAVAAAIGFGCTDECTFAYAQSTVQLRRSGK
jgi:hypothetical protein